MSFLLSTLKKVLFWSYERGTWQYDVMCVVILAFVFFVPNRWLDSQGSSATSPAGQMFISRDQLGAVDSDRIKEEVSEWLAEKNGHPVTVSEVNPQYDEFGNLTGYVVFER